jgi:glycosyltransferase involved in cell wall biosynthesis
MSCYKGEKEHGELMLLMREYGSLVLLSDGESDPLVLKEALMAGLPVVTNSHSGMPELPFLDIIPDNKVQDMKYIESVLEKSRQKDRTGIKEYASQFEWKKVVKDYVSILNHLIV